MPVFHVGALGLSRTGRHSPPRAKLNDAQILDLALKNLELKQRSHDMGTGVTCGARVEVQHVVNVLVPLDVANMGVPTDQHVRGILPQFFSDT